MSKIRFVTELQISHIYLGDVKIGLIHYRDWTMNPDCYEVSFHLSWLRDTMRFNTHDQCVRWIEKKLEDWMKKAGLVFAE